MMEDIKNDMLKVFDLLMDGFPSIAIRYEYSTEYGCFLVSIDVSSLNQAELDNFSDLYISNTKLLQDKYGNDAPLFCMNEEWFTLSSNAVTYNRNTSKETRKDFERADANVYRSIVRMRQLLYPSTASRLSSH